MFFPIDDYLLSNQCDTKRILLFTEGLDKPALANNEEKQSAILYQVIIIGEATKRLSAELQSQLCFVVWTEGRSRYPLNNA